MSDTILPPVEVIPAPPCRIDIIEYKRQAGRSYDVLFNGVKVGLVYRHSSVICWWIDGPAWTVSYRSRNEAAAALIRSVHPDWKGCAP